MLEFITIKIENYIFNFISTDISHKNIYSMFANKPCQNCIDNTKDHKNPAPCCHCNEYCYCDGNMKCNFCLYITGHILKSQKITTLMQQYPCYCSLNNDTDYVSLCLDCQQNYCDCNNKNTYLPKHKRKYHCSFCFEKEYNQIITIAKSTDFQI